MKTSRLVTASFALAFAAPVAAQNGAMWVDDYGRMMSMEFAGGSGAAPAPVDRSPAEMAAVFRKACIDTQADPAGLAAAAVALGLAADPLTVPVGKKAPPVVLNIHRAPGLVVSQTGGFFAAKVAQCNVTFYVNALPDRADMAAAVTAALGTSPANAASATKKNGTPNKNYEPEWATSFGGTPQVVAAHVGKGSQYMPGNRVQIAVRAVRKAK